MIIHLLREASSAVEPVNKIRSLPKVLDKLNVMSTIHLRKLITALVRENGQRDAVISKLEERIGVLEDGLNEMRSSQAAPAALTTN